MTVRHAVLSIGALLVLGLGVYLLVEVRAQPADPPVSPAASAAGAPSAVRTDAAERATFAAPLTSQPPPAAVRSTAAVPPPPSPAPPAPAPAASPSPDDSVPLSGPKLDAAMDEANKAYDRGDFDDAKTVASRLLARQPSNVRMLRIMVSASCIDGDSATAQANYVKLPAPDQAQMRVRCARYGITFPEKP